MIYIAVCVRVISTRAVTLCSGCDCWRLYACVCVFVYIFVC